MECVWYRLSYVIFRKASLSPPVLSALPLSPPIPLLPPNVSSFNCSTLTTIAFIGWRANGSCFQHSKHMSHHPSHKR
ncbi:hypothetical protein M404DRAFT_193637 [Pisolithus tinctorius Marx 270]|uniref:Uncharacterized protein n=1 Tax=Pisolithus tinctorius Marx 270 TaxID=870435 RepID=A0A0C3PL03_PISTI|nr:hypothetical protein M404DRAFT_193637 [Pisolithus tinctorius Marx 270]